MKTKLLLFFLSTICFFSCGDSDEPQGLNSTKGIYQVVFETSIPVDNNLQIQVYNTENVELYDDIDKKNLNVKSFYKPVSGNKFSYSTVEKVKGFTAQGIIKAEEPVTLTITVYKDKEQVYKRSIIVVPEDGIKDVFYTSFEE